VLAQDVPVWQPLVSVMILLAATAGLVALGARLYERTLLQTRPADGVPRGSGSENGLEHRG
jgi:hypothetical protein